MQIRDYWRIFSKRWWVIAVVCVMATAASIGYSRYETPIFRSSIRLDVLPARFDYGLTMVIENLLRQYAQQLQTDKMAEVVNTALKLDLSAENLRGRVKVSPVPEDYAIQIEVDDPDPNRAKDIAYTWANEFVKLHQVRMAPIEPRDRIEVTVHDNARPGEINRPKTRQNAIAAAALGIVIGALIIFLLEFLDDTFKTQEDIERYAALPVLGTIPNVDTAGKPYAVRQRKFPMSSTQRGT